MFAVNIFFDVSSPSTSLGLDTKNPGTWASCSLYRLLLNSKYDDFKFRLLHIGTILLRWNLGTLACCNRSLPNRIVLSVLSLSQVQMTCILVSSCSLHFLHKDLVVIFAMYKFFLKGYRSVARLFIILISLLCTTSS